MFSRNSNKKRAHRQIIRSLLKEDPMVKTPPTCVAAGCDSKKHLYEWPSFPVAAREQWTSFVRRGCPNFEVDRNSRLCRKHFTPTDFDDSVGEYHLSFAKMLKVGAVPSIETVLPPASMDESAHLDTSVKQEAILLSNVESLSPLVQEPDPHEVKDEPNDIEVDIPSPVVNTPSSDGSCVTATNIPDIAEVKSESPIPSGMLFPSKTIFSTSTSTCTDTATSTCTDTATSTCTDTSTFAITVNSTTFGTVTTSTSITSTAGIPSDSLIVATKPVVAPQPVTVLYRTVTTTTENSNPIIPFTSQLVTANVPSTQSVVQAQPIISSTVTYQPIITTVTECIPTTFKEAKSTHTESRPSCAQHTSLNEVIVRQSAKANHKELPLVVEHPRVVAALPLINNTIHSNTPPSTKAHVANKTSAVTKKPKMIPSKPSKPKSLPPTHDPHLVNICSKLGIRLITYQGTTYVHCPSVLSLFPPLKYSKDTKASELIKTVVDILDMYEIRSRQTCLLCFTAGEPNDVWMTANVGLLLIIRAYSSLRGRASIPLDQLIACYMRIFSDGKENISSFLDQFRHEKETKYNKSRVGECFAEEELPVSGSFRTCSSQTTKAVEDPFIKKLPLKEQLSHPNVIKKVAWIVQHDKFLNKIFWDSYNNGSATVINKVPNILKGDPTMANDASTQTGVPCVPVVILKPVEVKVDKTTSWVEETKDNPTDYLTPILDFVPNFEDGDRLVKNFGDNNNGKKDDEDFDSGNGKEFHQRNYQELVSEKNMELSYLPPPPEPPTNPHDIEKFYSDLIEYSDTSDEEPIESDNEWTPEMEYEPTRAKKRGRILEAEFSDSDEELEYAEDDRFKAKYHKKSCDLCGKPLPTFRFRGQNLCSKHRIPGGVKCAYSDCDFVGMTWVRVKSHIRIVHEKKPSDYHCNVCGKSFLSNQTLRIHKVSHQAHKPYVCDVCGRDFSQMNNLKAHSRQHTGEKPFQCEHCGASFTHNVSLKNHLCKVLGQRLKDVNPTEKIPHKGRPPASKKVIGL